MGRHSAPEPEPAEQRPIGDASADLAGQPALALLNPPLLEPWQPEGHHLSAVPPDAFPSDAFPPDGLQPAVPRSDQSPRRRREPAEHTQPIPILPSQRRVTVSMPMPAVPRSSPLGQVTGPPAEEVPVERVVATPVQRIRPLPRIARLPEVPLATESSSDHLSLVVPTPAPPAEATEATGPAGPTGPTEPDVDPPRAGSASSSPAPPTERPLLPEPRVLAEPQALPEPRGLPEPQVLPEPRGLPGRRTAAGEPVAPTPDIPRRRSSAASRAPRLLDGWAQRGRPADLAEHLRVHGELPRERYAGRIGALRLVEVAEQGGLRGRGGSGFPTARKMRSVLDSVTARKPAVVVANGCEGDLTSGKDELLLHAAPHLVLDGLALAAHAVGADQAILCLHRNSSAIESAERAIAERQDDPCEVHLVTTPGRYVASEASALVNFLTSGQARPTTVPPLPSERGVQGRPTLLDNVETLAQLALLARHGVDWYRSRGTKQSPGTMLITLDGAVREPGVYEVDLGTPTGQLIRMAGGATSAVQAVLVGGLGGSWLPLPAGANLALSYEDCRAAGVGLGVASLVLLPGDACGVSVTATILDYLAGESAGQCGPCMFGLPAVAQDFAALADGSTDPELSERLHRRLGVIPGRGACAHPDGAVRVAASALRVFADDVAGHLRGQPCGRPAHDALPLLTELPESTGGWR